MREIKSLNEVKVGYYYTVYEVRPKVLTMGMCKSCSPPSGDLELYAITESPYEHAVNELRNRFYNVFKRTGEISIFEMEPHEAMGVQDDIDDIESKNGYLLDTRFTGVTGAMTGMGGHWVPNNGTLVTKLDDL